MNAQFILPGFYEGYAIYGCFHELMNNYPEILIPNSEIYTIYGVFPNCIWNGGGTSFGPVVLQNEMRDIISFYNDKLNIPLTFTFTNPVLEKRHYNDIYANIIAEIGNNGKNNILVSDLEFEKYLRSTYTNYKYCRSVIASEYTPYLLESKYGKYEISVMKRSKNNDWQYLNTIPQEDRSSIEFLCTDPCPDNCPRIYSHYKAFGHSQLLFANDMIEIDCTNRSEEAMAFPEYFKATKLKSNITRKMIDEEYLPKGFCKFKCSGRASRANIMINLLQYLVKEEYRIDVLGILLNSVFGIT